MIRRIGATWLLDTRLTIRNGESLLLLLGIPIGLLLMFGATDILPIPKGADRETFVLAGLLALAVMSTAFVNLAIRLGFDRHYGVLKRLGATPLRRSEFLVANALGVLAVGALQWTILVGVGQAIGANIGRGLAVAALAALLASVGLVGGAFLVVGRLSGLAVLAAANAFYLLSLLISGGLFDRAELPGALADLGRLLPLGALTAIVQSNLDDALEATARDWLVLMVWAVVLPLAAVRTFRWEPSS